METPIKTEYALVEEKCEISSSNNVKKEIDEQAYVKQEYGNVMPSDVKQELDPVQNDIQFLGSVLQDQKPKVEIKEDAMEADNNTLTSDITNKHGTVNFTVQATTLANVESTIKNEVSMAEVKTK